MAHDENCEFQCLRQLDHAKWTFEKHIRCADARWWLGNDSQSFLASLKKLGSESNHAPSGKAGPDQSKTIWANEVFFCHVLRFHLSDLDKGQDKPSLGVKEHPPRTSGHPTSRIRRSGAGKVFGHNEK